jgi:hypothetical protein
MAIKLIMSSRRLLCSTDFTRMERHFPKCLAICHWWQGWRNRRKAYGRPALSLKEEPQNVATEPKTGTKLLSRQPNSVQRETYIRGNNNKKKIKEADFPAEAPESNSHKYEASNAEHSMHDLSSECP